MTSDPHRADDAALAADFRALFASADVGICRIDTESRQITDANAALVAMLGYPMHELSALTVDALMHPDEPLDGSAFRAALANGRAAARDARVVAKDGRTVWVRVEVAPVRDPDGRARRAILTVHDLSAAVDAAARAADDRERTHLALAAASAGAWEFRIADRTLIWSPELRALYGIPPAGPDMDYRTWRTLVHPDDARAAEPPMAEVEDTDSYVTEFRVRVGDEWKWLGSRARIIRDADGQPARVVGINIDQTAPRAAADAMAAAVARFSAAVDAIDAVLWTNSADGRMIGEQRGWAALTGQTQADYEGFGWSTAVHPDDVAATIEAWNAAVATRTPFVFEHRVRVADGRYRWFAVRALPLIVGDAIREWVGVHTDIDDARTADAALKARVAEAVAARETALAQLHEAQKLESIGQLTGGVAHDFNNLLTPIIGSLDLLARRAPDDRAARLIDGAMTAAERAKTLVQRLLAFSRRQSLEARAVDVVAIVVTLRDLLERSLGPGIALDITHDAEVIVAEVDPAQLELALLNLALNGRDAMEGEGTLTIAITCAARPDGAAPPGDQVRITVGDTGTGMDEATRRRAIEPFFTTKGIGKGTGLGLSMVHGLAAQSRGLLEIDSAPGHGTRVHLWLPVARAAPSDAPAPDVPPVIPRLRVLLVDDEPLVRATTAAMLADLGHDVVEADGAAAGLDRIADATDLLITDYLMPGMNGAQLIAAARARQPALPALVVTGFAEQETVAGVVQLAKPFQRDDLATAIARALATRE